MAIEVAKIEIKSVADAAGLADCIRGGGMAANEVVAVIGKTEGNGGVNDFTRILADQAFRGVLMKHGTRSEAEIHQIPMVWSGGCDGVITPHATVFARNGQTGTAGKSRLVMGVAMSPKILPEDIGRPAMVEKIAEGVRMAMKDAGITNPADVHYVQTKTPLLTIDTIQDAHRRGHDAFCEVHESMGVSNGTTGLGIAVALGEVARYRAEDICRNLDLYSSVASCSSGVELDCGQIVLFGNKDGAGGRYRIGHSVMKDALDIDGIYDAIRNAGLELPERPRAADLNGKLVNCFIKCEADRTAKLRGRRQIMLDDSDVHHHRHAKGAVGGVAAAAIGDAAVFVSVDAMHQGPQGGGPVIAIVDVGE
ncbi:ring-opening amidohydrolase [Phreatobacter stygius]|uniref:Barbiturase n=1 Tax=Phreatobacter stygius TaxID=1940610 RepID=A0A4D7B2E3_9HYPH|nr:ring-opening amidohydrolase [Phreatobacter stygius]QCI65203.1 ring-opening amidohydrolase [Phreatobacter stygius]